MIVSTLEANDVSAALDEALEEAGAPFDYELRVNLLEGFIARQGAFRVTILNELREHVRTALPQLTAVDDDDEEDEDDDEDEDEDDDEDEDEDDDEEDFDDDEDDDDDFDDDEDE